MTTKATTTAARTAAPSRPDLLAELHAVTDRLSIDDGRQVMAYMLGSAAQIIARSGPESVASFRAELLRAVTEVAA